MSTGKDINNLTGISDKDISKMADTPMEKRKEKVSFMERLSEVKKHFLDWNYWCLYIYYLF